MDHHLFCGDFSVGALIVYYPMQGHPFGARLGSTFGTMYTGSMCMVIVTAIPLMLNKLHQSEKNNPTAVGILFSYHHRGCRDEPVPGSADRPCCGASGHVPESKEDDCFFLFALVLIVSLPNVTHRIAQRGFNDPRIKIYHLFMEVCKDHPLIGVGFGRQTYTNPHLVDLKKYNENLPIEYRMKPNWIYNCPHNAYLDIAVRTGIIGLMFFLTIPALTLSMLWKTWENARSNDYRSWVVCLLAGFLSIMIQAVFIDFYDPSLVSLFTTLAMITILWNLVRKDRATLRNI